VKQRNNISKDQESSNHCGNNYKP